MNLKKIEGVYKSFSLTEKIIFGLIATVLIVSTIIALIKINETFLVEQPDRGGHLREGVVGTPRFVNPLIAVSSVDRDIVALVYSGLLRQTALGEFIPDLAESYTVSEDKLEYRFYLRPDAVFHDGQKVTADDVIFTILKIQESDTESPYRANWDGVTLERVSETEIVFKLNQSNDSFLKNTTIGILPRHLWSDIPIGGFSLSKFNTEPIGSGPYYIKKINRDDANIPISYELVAFKDFTLGRPFINKIDINFAKNDEDLIQMFENGLIDSIGSLKPENVAKISNDADKEINLITMPLPRVFGIFFNQNESPILAESEVREALSAATPKTEIIEEILYGFAEPADDPIPPNLEDGDVPIVYEDASIEGQVKSGQIILEKAGWKKNGNGVYVLERKDETLLLSLTLSTNNVPELVAVAEFVAKTWRSLGALVEIKIFETSDLNQTVIRPRNFEALLFGFIVEEDADLYAFWHSSRRLDPGLNITSYTNIKTDKILEDLRDGGVNSENHQSLLTELKKEIKNDQPVIFLYTPKFIYLVPEDIKSVEINNINSSDDRFMNVYEWFIETNRVWKIFN